MPAKDIRFRDTAWSEISEGVGTLAKAVKTTLGPCGRNVMINKSFGAPLVTKDGVENLSAFVPSSLKDVEKTIAEKGIMEFNPPVELSSKN